MFPQIIFGVKFHDNYNFLCRQNIFHTWRNIVYFRQVSFFRNFRLPQPIFEAGRYKSVEQEIRRHKFLSFFRKLIIAATQFIQLQKTDKIFKLIRRNILRKNLICKFHQFPADGFRIFFVKKVIPLSRSRFHSLVQFLKRILINPYIFQIDILQNLPLPAFPVLFQPLVQP